MRRFERAVLRSTSPGAASRQWSSLWSIGYVSHGPQEQSLQGQYVNMPPQLKRSRRMKRPHHSYGHPAARLRSTRRLLRPARPLNSLRLIELLSRLCSLAPISGSTRPPTFVATLSAPWVRSGLSSYIFVPGPPLRQCVVCISPGLLTSKTSPRDHQTHGLSHLTPIVCPAGNDPQPKSTTSNWTPPSSRWIKTRKTEAASAQRASSINCCTSRPYGCWS